DAFLGAADFGISLRAFELVPAADRVGPVQDRERPRIRSNIPGALSVLREVRAGRRGRSLEVRRTVRVSVSHLSPFLDGVQSRRSDDADGAAAADLRACPLHQRALLGVGTLR